jgi:hypothetical protein
VYDGDSTMLKPCNVFLFIFLGVLISDFNIKLKEYLFSIYVQRRLNLQYRNPRQA